jgi:hypothetical protein
VESLKGRIGRQEVVYMRYELLAKVEKAAEKLGVSKSDLYRHAILDYLGKLGMLQE